MNSLQIQPSKAYDLLFKSVEENTNIQTDKTRKDYFGVLKKVRDHYKGNLNDVDGLTKFIHENYTKNRATKILNIVVNYFKNDNKKHRLFYDLRDKYYKEIQNNQSV